MNTNDRQLVSKDVGEGSPLEEARKLQEETDAGKELILASFFVILRCTMDIF